MFIKQISVIYKKIILLYHLNVYIAESGKNIEIICIVLFANIIFKLWQGAFIPHSQSFPLSVTIIVFPWKNKPGF